MLAVWISQKNSSSFAHAKYASEIRDNRATLQSTIPSRSVGWVTVSRPPHSDATFRHSSPTDVIPEQDDWIAYGRRLNVLPAALQNTSASISLLPW